MSEQGRAGRWIGIEPRHLALQAVGASAEPAGLADGLIDAPGGLRAATEAFQRRWLKAAIARHQGSLARAAEEAGMDRSNFHRLARRMGLIFKSSSSAQLGAK